MLLPYLWDWGWKVNIEECHIGMWKKCNYYTILLIIILDLRVDWALSNLIIKWIYQSLCENLQQYPIKRVVIETTGVCDVVTMLRLLQFTLITDHRSIFPKRSGRIHRCLYRHQWNVDWTDLNATIWCYINVIQKLSKLSLRTVSTEFIMNCQIKNLDF